MGFMTNLPTRLTIEMGTQKETIKMPVMVENENNTKCVAISNVNERFN